MYSNFSFNSKFGFYSKQIKFSLLILILLLSIFDINIIEISAKEKNEKSENKSNLLPNTLFVRLSNLNINIKTLEDKIPGLKFKDQILKFNQSEYFNPQKNLKKSLNLESIKKNDLYKAEEKLVRTWQVDFSNTSFSNSDPVKISEYLKSNFKEFEIAEPYYIYKIQEAYTPNDLYLFKQSAYLKNIKAQEAWAIEKGNPNITIGISDVGVNQNHEDIIDNLYKFNSDPVNGIDDDNNGYIDDYNGFNLGSFATLQNWNTTIGGSHGQHVAGIAAASFDNSKGIAGIGGKCKLFPIKLSPDDDLNTPLFAYQSIVFAAIRGLKVVNCSWGLYKGYSDIEQSIIDFAVAKDVVLIIAAGNMDLDYVDEQRFGTYYPASYKGVLGVGEVDQSDIITSSSTIGSHCKIMAPGVGNYSTENSQGVYSTLGSGTSYAAPVVAGAAAIVRSKYPNLNARQVIEFLRQCTDNIGKNNSDYDMAIPGRLNMLKSVTIDPMSIMGLSLENIEYIDSDGNKTDRHKVNEEITMNLRLKNFLGSAKKVDFKLSIAFDFGSNAIDFINDFTSIASIDTNSEIIIKDFKFKKNKEVQNKLVFRLDFADEKGNEDFILFDYNTSNQITNFENDAIQFSVCDEATIGYNKLKYNKQGLGFSLKSYGNGLYNSGLLLTNGSNSYAYSLKSQSNDFIAVKKYANPDNTAKFSSNLFVDVETEVFVPSGNKPYTRFKLIVTNNTDKAIQNLGVGYKFDWDIGKQDSAYTVNQTGLAQDAIPQEMLGKNSAVQFAKYAFDDVVYGSGFYSSNTNDIAQAAGFVEDSPSYYAGLNSGVSIQNSAIGDISYIVGMNFTGEIKSGESKECTMCIAAGSNRTEFVNAMKECLKSSFTDIAEENNNSTANVKLINDILYINSNDFTNFYISDLLGNVILNGTNSKSELSNNAEINVSNLSSGSYFIVLGSNQNSKHTFSKFIK